MATFQLHHHQCRTFRHTFQFEVKGPQEMDFKVMDVAGKVLFFGACRSEQLGVRDFTEGLKGFDWIGSLTVLAGLQLLPEKFVPKAPKVVDIQTFIDLIDAQIAKILPRLTAGDADVAALSCPITHELFQNPVTDACGHTFERGVIEAHKQANGDVCPLSRMPIGELRPNLAIKDQVDTLKARMVKVPNFTLFKKENDRLASSNIETAKAYAGEKEYPEALKAFEKALRYTQKWEDYVWLCKLYLQMKEPDKAMVAALNLAKYQLQAGATAQAIEHLREFEDVESSLLLVKLYQLLGREEESMNLAVRTANRISKTDIDKAKTLYKYVLKRHPEKYNLYHQLAEIEGTPMAQAHVLLKGGCAAIQRGNFPNAKELLDEAKRKTRPSLTSCFPMLMLAHAKKSKEDFLNELQQIDTIDDPYAERIRCEMLWVINGDTDTLERLVELSKTQGGVSANTYVALLTQLINAAKFKRAEKVAEEALNHLQGQNVIQILELAESLFRDRNPKKLEESLIRLASAYKAARQIDKVEETYKKAFEVAGNLTPLLAWAQMIGERGDVQGAVEKYYSALAPILMGNDINLLNHVVDGISTVDPKFTHLTLEQRVHLHTQKQLLAQQRRIDTLEQKRLEMEGEIADLKAPKPANQNQDLVQPLPPEAIGNEVWEAHLPGVSKVVKPLPANIEEILNSPCPFQPGKTVRETHILAYVPEKVGKVPIDARELYDTAVATGISFNAPCPPCREKISNGGWVLLTKKPLPITIGMNQLDATKAVMQACARLGRPYSQPNLPELLACLTGYYSARQPAFFLSQSVMIEGVYSDCEGRGRYNSNILVGPFQADTIYLAKSIPASVVAGGSLGICYLNVPVPLPTFRDSACQASERNSHLIAGQPVFEETPAATGPAANARPRIPAQAFGAEFWRERYGHVEDAPPLPANIHTILQQPCPFGKGTIGESHFLVYLPRELFSEEHLERLGLARDKAVLIDYDKPPNGLFNPISQWVLMYGDVRYGPREKKYTSYVKSKIGNLPYEIPRVGEAAVFCLLCDHQVTRLRKDPAILSCTVHGAHCQMHGSSKEIARVSRFTPHFDDPRSHVKNFELCERSGVGCTLLVRRLS